MKKIIISMIILSSTFNLFAQDKEVTAIKAVLEKYKEAIEKLDVRGTENLFTADSKVFESGGSEGTYAHYLEHHLIPEFKEFKSFKYTDYTIDIEVSNNFAFATEIYNYTIIPAKDNTEVKRKGVATSILKRTNSGWKIVVSHNSSRR
jgi:uncharacterized protein (TIGR02246 family)